MKILVVDDDMLIRMVLNKYFSNAGHEVVVTFDGKDALDHFYEDPNSFEAVITDIMMPRVNGIDLADEIKKTNPSLPIIAITAGNLDEISKHESLFEASFNKPIELAKLHQIILDAVGEN
ncbi:response regulator [Belliella aquatica]|uniref:Response regulatory domain-containing protein n=1 Tax=Belliella aquatica TaxID=1323734 RepID=A0ABQ1N4F5_9BACT|nr:response regulator [Belliella aquatica]MCH7407380.1 response regulator [Belliella aquatica]GGC52963.1 hypothetical protein GCM10010993_34250 [Belliella aquatica]